MNGLTQLDNMTLAGIFYLIISVIGIVLALKTILYAKNARGAIAWALGLISYPFVTIPLYFLFKRRKFEGYVEQRKWGSDQILPEIKKFSKSIEEAHVTDQDGLEHFKILEKLVALPFTEGNRAQLLIDGEQSYKEMFQAIDQASSYIALQFFIIREDRLGNELKDKLIAAKKRGVSVYFIYDVMGSVGLSPQYVRELESLGIGISGFRSSNRLDRLHINFRNHRKLLIVDGERAFLGGLNVGVEYLGEDPDLSPWRDTHMSLTGPSVICLQIPFAEDWHWCTGELPQFKWEVSQKTLTKGQDKVLVLPSGPSDKFETCSFTFNQMITQAHKRLWMSSPYFVPDNTLVSNLELCALRGVDVRILLPSRPDHLMVYYARYDFLERLQKAGVKFYIYNKGFLHQKLYLVDDQYSFVTSANLDNRSMRLNFELGAMVYSSSFADTVAKTFESDFENSTFLEEFSLDSYSLGFRLLVKISRLFSPIL